MQVTSSIYHVPVMQRKVQPARDALHFTRFQRAADVYDAFDICALKGKRHTLVNPIWLPDSGYI